MSLGIFLAAFLGGAGFGFWFGLRRSRLVVIWAAEEEHDGSE